MHLLLALLRRNFRLPKKYYYCVIALLSFISFLFSLSIYLENNFVIRKGNLYLHSTSSLENVNNDISVVDKSSPLSAAAEKNASRLLRWNLEGNEIQFESNVNPIFHINQTLTSLIENTKIFPPYLEEEYGNYMYNHSPFFHHRFSFSSVLQNISYFKIVTFIIPIAFGLILHSRKQIGEDIQHKVLIYLRVTSNNQPLYLYSHLLSNFIILLILSIPTLFVISLHEPYIALFILLTQTLCYFQFWSLSSILHPSTSYPLACLLIALSNGSIFITTPNTLLQFLLPHYCTFKLVVYRTLWRKSNEEMQLASGISTQRACVIAILQTAILFIIATIRLHSYSCTAGTLRHSFFSYYLIAPLQRLVSFLNSLFSSSASKTNSKKKKRTSPKAHNEQGVQEITRILDLVDNEEVPSTKASKPSTAPPITHLREPPSLLQKQLIRQNKVVTVESVVKSYHQENKKNTTALNRISCQFYQGHVYVLLGHNGAGKTTLLNCITGMEQIDQGEIRIFDQQVSNLEDETRSLIGYCFQEDVVMEKSTVMEQLLFYSLARNSARKKEKRMSKEALERDATRLLCLMQLDHKKNIQVERLSKGELRKLNIAMAFACESKVVILDEPTSRIDPLSRVEINEIIHQLKRDRVVLMTTHYINEEELVVDTIGIMNDGKMIIEGSLAYIKEMVPSSYRVAILFKDDEGSSTQNKSLGGENRSVTQVVKRSNNDKGEKHDSKKDPERGCFRSQILESKKSYVWSHIKTLFPQITVITNISKELIFRLPGDFKDEDMMKLFNCLESHKNSVSGVLSYEVQANSLEDIFLDVIQRSHQNRLNTFANGTSTTKHGNCKARENKNETMDGVLDNKKDDSITDNCTVQENNNNGQKRSENDEIGRKDKDKGDYRIESSGFNAQCRPREKLTEIDNYEENDKTHQLMSDAQKKKKKHPSEFLDDNKKVSFTTVDRSRSDPGGTNDAGSDFFLSLEKIKYISFDYGLETPLLQGVSSENEDNTNTHLPTVPFIPKVSSKSKKQRNLFYVLCRRALYFWQKLYFYVHLPFYRSQRASWIKLLLVLMVVSALQLWASLFFSSSLAGKMMSLQSMYDRASRELSIGSNNYSLFHFSNDKMFDQSPFLVPPPLHSQSLKKPLPFAHIRICYNESLSNHAESLKSHILTIEPKLKVDIVPAIITEPFLERKILQSFSSRMFKSFRHFLQYIIFIDNYHYVSRYHEIMDDREGSLDMADNFLTKAVCASSFSYQSSANTDVEDSIMQIVIRSPYSPYQHLIKEDNRKQLFFFYPNKYFGQISIFHHRHVLSTLGLLEPVSFKFKPSLSNKKETKENHSPRVDFYTFFVIELLAIIITVHYVTRTQADYSKNSYFYFLSKTGHSIISLRLPVFIVGIFITCVLTIYFSFLLYLVPSANIKWENMFVILHVGVTASALIASYGSEILVALATCFVLLPMNRSELAFSRWLDFFLARGLSVADVTNKMLLRLSSNPNPMYASREQSLLSFAPTSLLLQHLLASMFLIFLVETVKQIWKMNFIYQILHPGPFVPLNDNKGDANCLVNGFSNPENDIAASNIVIVHKNAHSNPSNSDESSHTIALKNINISVLHSDIVCLIGENGAGKTSLLNALAGCNRVNRGVLRVEDYNPASPFNVFCNMFKDPVFAYAPDWDCLIFSMTVYEHAHYACVIHNIKNPKQVIEEHLDIFGLVHQKHHVISTLSAGNVRRVVAMVTMLSSARIILLDEATASIDFITRKRLWGSIRTVIERSPHPYSVLYSTHSIDEAELFSGKMIVLSKGTVRCCNSVSEIKSEYNSHYRVRVRIKNPQGYEILMLLEDTLSYYKKDTVTLEDFCSIILPQWGVFSKLPSVEVYRREAKLRGLHVRSGLLSEMEKMNVYGFKGENLHVRFHKDKEKSVKVRELANWWIHQNYANRILETLALYFPFGSLVHVEDNVFQFQINKEKCAKNYNEVYQSFLNWKSHWSDIYAGASISNTSFLDAMRILQS